MAKTCHKCGEEWDDKRNPGFREECISCGEPLHCCANCRFYDEGASQWCREPQARKERPRDVKQANTCEYFLFADIADHGASYERERKAKEGLAALFGEVPPEKTQNDDNKPDWMKMG